MTPATPPPVEREPTQQIKLFTRMHSIGLGFLEIVFWLGLMIGVPVVLARAPVAMAAGIAYFCGPAR